MNVDTALKSPVILSLCPGIRGLERGIEKALGGKLRVAAYVEIEAFIIANLLAGMEAGLLDAAPIWSNLKTFNARPFRGKIHGIIGGYPCQPFSVAGVRKGTSDPRHLYPFISRCIKKSRPLCVSLKMSRATYHSVSTLYKRTYERWVTRLRLESIQRKKPVHLIEGTGSLFSHWKTPSASECEGGQLKFKPQQNQNVKYKLRDQVSWPTPDTTDTDFCEGVALKGNRRKGPKNFYQAVNWSTPVSSRAPRASEGYYPNLVEQAKSWGTPTTRDYKDGAAESVANVPENGLLGRMDLPTQQSILNAGQQDQVKTNTIGKSRASLNPAWVAQLMGTTSEKIFFVHSVTAWLNKPQNLLSSTSSKNTESA
jgi:hypothetical protein